MVQAKHLMKKDIGVLGKGKSDPYAIISVGAQEFRTKTIDNTVDPKWDYWCEVCKLFFSIFSIDAQNACFFSFLELIYKKKTFQFLMRAFTIW